MVREGCIGEDEVGRLRGGEVVEFSVLESDGMVNLPGRAGLGGGQGGGGKRRGGFEHRWAVVDADGEAGAQGSGQVGGELARSAAKVIDGAAGDGGAEGDQFVKGLSTFSSELVVLAGFPGVGCGWFVLLVGHGPSLH